MWYTNVWKIDIGGRWSILTGMVSAKAEFDRALGGRIRAARDRAGVKQEQLAAWFYVANILLNLDETITKG